MAPFVPHKLTPEETASKAQLRFVNVWTVVGAILISAVVIACLSILAVPMGMIFWTVIFVFVLSGTVNKLEDHGVPRVWGTTIAYVILAVVLAVLALLLFSPAFGFNAQFSELLDNMPRYIENFMAWASQIYNHISSIFDNETLQSWISQASSAVAAAASSFFEGSASSLVSFGTGFANGVMALGLGVVLAFWVLIELPAFGREVFRIAGPKRADDIKLFHLTATRVVGGFIKATLLQCTIIGVGCGVLFVITGVPSAVAVAGITAVVNIIPVIGPLFGCVIPAIVGLFASPAIALIALVGTAVIQQLVFTFVSPKIMQDSVDIHPALTLLVLFSGSAIGNALGGLGGSLVGMLAAIPSVAIMKSLFVYYFEKKTGRQIVSADGVFFKGVPTDPEHFSPMLDALAPADHSKVAIDPSPVIKMITDPFVQNHGGSSKASKDKDEGASKDNHA